MMTLSLVLKILGVSVGLVFFFRPAWVARRAAGLKELQQIRIFGLIVWGALAVSGIVHLFILSGALPISPTYRLTPAAAWHLFMGVCTVGYAIVGLMWFRKPEKFANRIVSAREIRRFGILLWLLAALNTIYLF